VQNNLRNANVLPGQQVSLQGIVIEEILLPVQFLPPQEGLGLLHSLIKYITPPPHVLLHGPSIQLLHPPSTTEQMIMKLATHKTVVVGMKTIYSTQIFCIGTENYTHMHTCYNNQTFLILS